MSSFTRHGNMDEDFYLLNILLIQIKVIRMLYVETYYNDLTCLE